MDYDTAPRSAGETSQSTTFLSATFNRLDDVKQVLYGINERLNASGFYAGPAVAPKEKAPPAENNQRAAIDEVIERLAETAASIREQVNRLVG